MLESKSSSSTERRPENYLNFLNYRSLLHSGKKGTNSSLELTKTSDLYETP